MTAQRGEGVWGSAVACSTRTSLLNASVLLRPVRQVRCGLKSRHVWAWMPETR